MRDDRRYLERIIEHCTLIKEDRERYGDDIETYFEDNSYQRATDMSLQQIGENVRKLSPELQKKYSEIRWDAVIGFRNIIAHRYEWMNRTTIWDIICNEVPPLKEYCKAILQELTEEKR